MEILSYNSVCLLVCIGEPAKCFVITYAIIHKGERYNFIVAHLLLHLRIVKTAAEASCRSSGLKTTQLHTLFLKIFCKLIGRCQTVWTAGKCTVSDKNLSCEESTCCQNYSLCFVPCMGLGLNTAYFSILDYYIRNLTLSHIKVRGVFYSSLHFDVIFILISLGTKRMHGRAFCCVEHLALNKGLVDIFSHLSAECIYFPYQVALTCSADRRIARHHSHSFKIYRKHQCFLSHTCRSKCSFTSGMSCTNYYHIIFTH